MVVEQANPKSSVNVSKTISLNPFDSDDECNADKIDDIEKADQKPNLNPFGSETSSETSNSDDNCTQNVSKTDLVTESPDSCRECVVKTTNPQCDPKNSPTEELTAHVNIGNNLSDQNQSGCAILGSVESFHSSCIDVDVISTKEDDNKSELISDKDLQSVYSNDFGLSPSQLNICISESESDTDFKIDEDCLDRFLVDSETEQISVKTSSST